MLNLDFSAVLQGQYLDWLIGGAFTTLWLFAAAWVCAFVLAVILVPLRALALPPLEWLIAGYVNYHRNVPGLVQIFVWYFGIPELLPAFITGFINDHNGEFIFALIALSLNSAAYMSEDLRSGLRSVAATQMEAARALGLSYVQSMRDVLLPQAIRISVPPLVNQSLSLFKSTSLAMAIGVAEMTYASRQIENETYRTFETFALASAFYLILSWTIMAVGGWYNGRNLKAKGR
ncbi:MAG: putative glutamine ABC transporter permease protein GlnM [Herbaspirillum frisingense]|uniref:Putative glutamine ABC transporter permease protein GlnM n=1 Tax=Herbaspirillum frisingense TaxID=92645 RepID=A0A7V8JTE8_9BURK|nr:MAG: putative glutamine ABC transporter permease protein GlnM [Herbaspirillum frisingense]